MALYQIVAGDVLTAALNAAAGVAERWNRRRSKRSMTVTFALVNFATE
jgi:hypothetical protein